MDRELKRVKGDNIIVRKCHVCGEISESFKELNFIGGDGFRFKDNGFCMDSYISHTGFFNNTGENFQEPFFR